MKRLFIFTCPERLSEEDSAKMVAMFDGIFKDCGIIARVLILDGGWGIQEICPDQILVGPEPENHD